MKQCEYRYLRSGTVGICGSYAFNLHKDVPSIDQGDYCDKCYWRNIVESSMNLKPVRWIGVTPQTVPEQDIKLLKEKVCVLETKVINLTKEHNARTRTALWKIAGCLDRLSVIENKIKLLEDREMNSIRESVGLPKSKKKKPRRKKTKATATINELWVVEKQEKARKK